MNFSLPVFLHGLKVAISTVLSSWLDVTFVLIMHACILIISFISDNGLDTLNVRKYTEILIKIFKMPS